MRVHPHLVAEQVSKSLQQPYYSFSTAAPSAQGGIEIRE